MRTVGIGKQDFEKIRKTNCFYIDKTLFIKEWWENQDDVTLITRPRRFGKTLNMSMVEQFFSVEYKDCHDLFENLKIWKFDKYRKLQGTYPVISLSFADIKETNFYNAKAKICQSITSLYDRYQKILFEDDFLSTSEKEYFQQISAKMDDYIAAGSIKKLSELLSRYYKQKVIILLDEYDTPMQEAYVNGYWKEMVAYVRALFNSTLKTNPYMERAIMTGITRICKESVFSDLNNLEIVTTTSNKYEAFFGFTEEEVYSALCEYQMEEKMPEIKAWYDGFCFGNTKDIYNPWSIINYLDKKRLGSYWANTSSNSLVGELIRQGNSEIKMDFEKLMQGESLKKRFDEQIVFEQISYDENAIWSLLLASGYLKLKNYFLDENTGDFWYEIMLTNKEVLLMFKNLIRGWFSKEQSTYNAFVKALLIGDIKAMNVYMNRVALTTFSYFDTGKNSSGYTEPERFYHGFVLGLLVDLSDKYFVVSNRESGFGRYDVVIEPKDLKEEAYILEFKVLDPEEEKSLAETVKSALKQIEEKQYAEELLARGIPEANIKKYGFAFSGKQVLIGR